MTASPKCEKPVYEEDVVIAAASEPPERVARTASEARDDLEKKLATALGELRNARRDSERMAEELRKRNVQLDLLWQMAFFSQQDPDKPALLQAFIDSVCQQCAWPIGVAYLPVDEGLLKATRFYVDQDNVAGLRLCDVLKETPIEKGEGLAGRVYEFGRTEFIEDLTNISNTQRAAFFAELGVKSAFAIPIRAFGEVAAVVEFFSTASVQQDREFMHFVEAASLQLGTGVERRESEIQLRENIASLEGLNKELSEAQHQLVQSEKLASLGQLAAGVAHEINNPIGFVLSNFNTLKEYLATLATLTNKYVEFERAVGAPSGTAAALAKSIKDYRDENDVPFILEDADCLSDESIDGLNRVREIVAGLKSFARVDGPEFCEASLNDLLEVSLRMVWNDLKYKCEIKRNLAEIPPIRCHPGQINQVFTNLLVNAGQAIETSGVITVNTYQQAQEVVVEIVDNGKGIPADIRAEIFNPFFTTKPVGEGTGLGLSVSYGIVQKHRGEIAVESEVGKGTTFRVSFPLDVNIEK